jgi:hypothetical protein
MRFQINTEAWFVSAMKCVKYSQVYNERHIDHFYMTASAYDRKSCE